MTSAPLDKQINKPAHGEAAESCDTPAICLFDVVSVAQHFFSRAKCRDEESDCGLSRHTQCSDVLQTVKWFCGKQRSADLRSALQTH